MMIAKASSVPPQSDLRFRVDHVGFRSVVAMAATAGVAAAAATITCTVLAYLLFRATGLLQALDQLFTTLSGEPADLMSDRSLFVFVGIGALTGAGELAAALVCGVIGWVALRFFGSSTGGLPVRFARYGSSREKI